MLKPFSLGLFLAVGVLLATDAEKASADGAPTDSLDEPLPPGAVARIGTTRLRHVDTVSSLAYSPDGKRLISTDGWSVGVWDPRTGRCLAFRRLPPQPIITWSPVVSPDGTLIACRLENGNLGVQETESGKVRCDLGCEDSEIHSLSFSNDNRWLVASVNENKVLLWDVRAGKLSQQWKSPGKETSWFRHVFTPDGKTLVHSPDSGQLLFWDVHSGKELLKTERNEKEDQKDDPSVYGLAISPDGKLLATLGSLRIGLWDVKTGHFLRDIDTQANSLGPMIFSPDDKQVLTSRESGEICFWDVATAKLTRELKAAPEGHAESLAFSPDGKYLAGGGHDHAVHLWDLTTGKEMFPNKSDLGGCASARFLSDGKTLLSHCGYDTQLFAGKVNARLGFWDLKGKSIRNVTFDTKAAHALAIAPDASIIALAEGPNFGGDFRPVPNGGLKSSIRLCDAASGKELVRAKDLRCLISDLGLSPDGRFLFASAYNAGPNDEDYHRLEVIQVWNLSSPTSLDKVAELPTAELEFSAPSFCAPDSKWIGVPMKSGWDFYQCESGKLLRHYPELPGNVHAASLSGRVLACTDDEKRTAALVELATGKPICKLDCKPRYLYRPRFAISPDGGVVASGLNAETIILWDAFTGKQIGKLEGHRGGVCSLCFSPDGRYLISGSGDTTILIWDYRTQLPKPAGEKAELSPKRLDELWQDLQASDPERGYRAVAVLVQAPGQAIALFKEKMRPAVAADHDPYQTWVEELDSDQFETREKAMAELSKAGELAEPVLRRTLTKPISLETKKRLNTLLEKIPTAPPSSAWLATLRALETLERIGTPEAQKLLEQLGKGLAESAQTREAGQSLERLNKRMADSKPRQDPK
jgi:WD40 repeat protein